MVVVLCRYTKINMDISQQPVKNIAEANLFNAATAISKEANTVMNVSGNEKKCEKKKNEAAYSDPAINHNDNSGNC